MQEFKVNDKVCPWGDNRIGTVTALNEVAYWSQRGQTVTVVFEGDEKFHYFSPKELTLAK